MAYQEIIDLQPLYISITDSRKGSNDYKLELTASATFFSCRKDCIWLRLFKMDETAMPKATKENLAARKQWMEDNQAILKYHVKAIVNVVDDPFFEQAQKIKIQKAYGVRGTCCKTVIEALEWIEGHVDLPEVQKLNKCKVIAKIKSLEINDFK